MQRREGLKIRVKGVMVFFDKTQRLKCLSFMSFSSFMFQWRKINYFSVGPRQMCNAFLKKSSIIKFKDLKNILARVKFPACKAI